MTDDALHDFTDRAIRDLLSRAENLQELLEAAVPTLADGFDVSRMKPAPREYFLGNWRRRSPDLLFEIPYRTADTESLALVCVLMEHQSKTDWQIPLKTFIYAALYWEWQWREWEEAKPPKSAFSLTPVLPIVLHTGSRPWGSAKTLRELLAPPTPFHSFVPDWQPLFWELANHSADELLHGKAAFLQAISILKAEEDLVDAEHLFRAVFRQIDPLHETSRVRWAELLRFLLGWAYHKRPAMERPHWHSVATGLTASAEREREYKSMGMTIAQEIFQEGKLEGVQQGEREGLLKGQLKQARATLLRFGRKRLGEPDLAMRDALDNINDLERLERMADSLDQASSWADLLATR